MRSFILTLAVKYQILFIVSATVILAFSLATFCGLFFDEHQLRSNIDVISATYQVMGVVYGILLTFALWGVWQNFTEADKSAQQEAYAILDLVHMLEAAATWKNSLIRSKALTYLNLVIEKEWACLATAKNNFKFLHEQSHAASQSLVSAVQAIRPVDERERVLFNQTLVLLDSWLDARRTRILMAGGDSAKALWPLLFTGACVLFAFHGLFVTSTLGIWIILLLGVSLVIGLTFYLIFTFDSPFTGSPSVATEPLIMAIDVLKGDTNMHIDD